uniref:NADH dehydrogenase subunit 2 n=1 Tax=Coryphella verrucosa TaxID=2059235 RepID=UPI0025520C41|nr:NADH dehydrogenase subunit 2 [Coryphella verrucosa]WFQ82021.1 NADH dehydrogenase subunit 2 [Coryphella verrucosa]
MSVGNVVFYFLMGLGPIVALSSSSWVVCWAGVELSFLGLIPLLLGSKDKDSSLGKEACMKYFCIQAVGSGLLMWGGIMMFLIPNSFVMVSQFFFMFGLLVKLGMFPAHFWVLGVVGLLDWAPLFFVLTWQKIAPFLFLMNLIENNIWLQDVLLLMGGLSAVVGAVIGLNQTKLAPMLGASSITHTGWAAVAVVYGNFWIYYVCYFCSLLLLLLNISGSDKFMSGFLLLGLAGLPPFFMFAAKWSVMSAVLSMCGEWWVLGLPLFGSTLSLFFYLKFFYSFYLETSSEENVFSTFFAFASIVGVIGTFYIVGF